MAQNQQGSGLKDPLIVRIFVSSPFNGMERERDCLSKHYWPRLTSVLISKGLLLRVVDLRWGITKEMSSDNQTITTCLREIDRSDIFVGLYGQRYGWSGIGDEALQKNFDRSLERFPWVDGFRDRSITELEYLHGHLNNPGEMAACFALRNQEYDNMVRQDAVDSGDVKKQRNYSCENPESQALLLDLRERVEKTQDKTFGVVVDYMTPEEGAEFIYKCVREHIDENIFSKMNEPVSQWERGQRAHNIFMMSRGGIYVGGERYAEQLDEYASREGSTPPLVITGATGCGKTALLSSWLIARRDSKQKDVVVSHFVGADPKSSKPATLVQRIHGNVNYQLYHKLPKLTNLKLKPEILMAKMSESLLMMEKEEHAGKKLIIIVDRVDELDTEKPLKLLFWLPTVLPKNVRIILTVTTGSEQASAMVKTLQDQYNSVVLEIEQLSEKDKRVLCNDVLKQYSKSMEPEQVEMILDSPKTSQPMFLKVLITELCALGQFRKLNEQIENLLQCENMTILLCSVLKRLENEYNHPDYDGSLVKDVLCAMCLCKRGISELELPMPQHMWTPLIYAMEEYLINRSGLLSFSFPELTAAVELTYLPNKESRQQAARKVSEIFYQPFNACLANRTPLTKRVCIELPHLLAEAKDNSRLLEVVSNIKVFEMVYHSTPFSLNDYWQELGLPSDVIARRYLQSLDNYVASRYSTHMKNMNSEAVTYLMDWKGNVLHDIRCWMETSKMYNGIEIIFDREISLMSRVVGQTTLEQIQNMYHIKFDKACFLANTGRYQEAFDLHHDVLSMGNRLVHEKVMKTDEIAKSFNATGRCCYKLGRLVEAETWYTLAMENLMGNSEQKVHLAWVYYNLGQTHYHQDGNNHQHIAIEYYKKASSLWEEIAPHCLSLGVAVNLLNIGRVFQKLGELDQAEIYFNKALTVNRTLLGNDSVDVAKCLISLSLLEREKKNHWKSLELVQESVRIFKMMAPVDYHWTTEANEAMVMELMQVGDFEKAVPIVENLVSLLGKSKLDVSSTPDIYVHFFVQCLKNGEYVKVVDLVDKLLQTANESDALLSLLLQALLSMPKNKETRNKYIAQLEYGLSRWPQSKSILQVHLADLRRKEQAQVLPFIKKHCEGQEGEPAVGDCYFTVCVILEEELNDVQLTKQALTLGLQYTSMHEKLNNLSTRLQTM